jgi:hypothetical protein
VASYTLIASYSTVQVLGPTAIQNVLYFTLQTSPSSVVASVPVNEEEFLVNGAVPILLSFAEAVETIMAEPQVIAGVGSQSIDSSGLLADQVTFTVQYTGPGAASSGVTADVDVPVQMLNFSEEPRDQGNAALAQALIDQTYNALQSAAGG